MDSFLDAHLWLDVGTRVIAISSLLLFALHRAEQVFEIWIPKAEDSRFWLYFDRIHKTLQVISVSSQRKNGNGKPAAK